MLHAGRLGWDGSRRPLMSTEGLLASLLPRDAARRAR